MQSRTWIAFCAFRDEEPIKIDVSRRCLTQERGTPHEDAPAATSLKRSLSGSSGHQGWSTKAPTDRDPIDVFGRRHKRSGRRRHQQRSGWVRLAQQSSDGSPEFLGQ